MYFVENILGMDELFEVSFSPLAATGKALSRYGQGISQNLSFFVTKITQINIPFA